MPCSLCGMNGHNVRTCVSRQNVTTSTGQNIDLIFDEIRYMYMRVSSYFNPKNKELIKSIREKNPYLKNRTREEIKRFNEKFLGWKRCDTFRKILLDKSNTYIDCLEHVSRKQLGSIVKKYCGETDIKNKSDYDLAQILLNYFKKTVVIDKNTTFPIAKKFIYYNIELSNKPSNVKSDCPICLTKKFSNLFVNFDCNHQVCGDCVLEMISNNHESCKNCPLCRTPIKKYITKNETIYIKIDKKNPTKLYRTKFDL